MFESKLTRYIRILLKSKKTVIILLPCFLIITLYLLSEKYDDLKNYLKDYNTLEDNHDNYLVWNSKCHMLTQSYVDSSIEQYIKKEKYESCSNIKLLSKIIKTIDNKFYLVIDKSVGDYEYDEFNCCWTPINRAVPITQTPDEDWDNKINIGYCEDFKDRILIPENIEIVMITCRAGRITKNAKLTRIIYQNIHSIINPKKVKNNILNDNNKRKKMSILIMGLDSVSRLNFHRTMPKLSKYFHDNNWHELKGYNKIGDNTLPNLLALLTGRNQDDATKECKLNSKYGSDGCPFIWNNFKNAGYITAYGEDIPRLGTFNYKQDGFMNPPTDYYVRPYILACEKLLKSKKKFNFKYCIGPESAVDRIFNYAIDFSKTFIDKSYFGFFWTNTISHDDMNGPSSMDEHFLKMFQDVNDNGITNNTIIIFLSDHGVRWGEYLDTQIGWHENRLPFMFIKFPNSILNHNNLSKSLKLNEYRLTSPYDVYQTLREILINSGGYAKSSIACPTCQSLFSPVPIERGCDDAGISSHWCTCNEFQATNTNNYVALSGANAFIKHAENIAKNYKDENGNRLCAKLEIDSILKIDKIIDFNNVNQTNNIDKYFFKIQVKPGYGKFEATISTNNYNEFYILDSEISRIDSYEKTSRCVDYGFKWFCHCLDYNSS